MGRPRVRTEFLDLEHRRMLRETFGTAPHAYKQLRVYEAMTYHEFQRVLAGKESRPEVVRAVESGWLNWSTRLIMTVREKQKDEEGVAA